MYIATYSINYAVWLGQTDKINMYDEIFRKIFMAPQKPQIPQKI